MNVFKEYCRGKTALEIGGPSSEVYELGIYSELKSIDNVNFGSNIWSGIVTEGPNKYICFNRLGYQYVCEATNLDKILDNQYDLVLSCHMLEHIANPLLALKESIRVLKNNGIFLLILPNKKHCFDHNREDTPFEHLLQDYNNNITERDLTHYDEIMSKHDLSMDPPAGDINNFSKRSLDNYNNRCLHHHIFSTKTIQDMFSFFNIDLLHIEESYSYRALGKVIK